MDIYFSVNLKKEEVPELWKIIQINRNQLLHNYQNSKFIAVKLWLI